MACSDNKIMAPLQQNVRDNDSDKDNNNQKQH